MRNKYITIPYEEYLELEKIKNEQRDKIKSAIEETYEECSKYMEDIHGNKFKRHKTDLTWIISKYVNS